MEKTVEEYIEDLKRGKIKFNQISNETLIKYPQICMYILRLSRRLKIIPECVILEHPQIAIEAVNLNLGNLRYVPENIKIENSQMCIDAVRKDPNVLKYIPEIIKLNNSKICINAIDKCPEMLEYVPKKVMLDNKEACLIAVYENKSLLRYLPQEIMIENPNFCIEVLYDYPEFLETIPDKIKLYDLDSIIHLVSLNPHLITILSNKLKLEILKFDEYAYKIFPEEILKSVKEIDEYMFGDDLERFYALRERGNYNLSVEENSLGDMNVFYHKMIKSIGIDEVEKLIEVPSLTREEIERYQLQYNEKFNELFDKKYTLTGDTEALVKIFRGIDLRGYKTKGKNARFEVFKNINKILEENNINLDELVSRAISSSGFEIDSKVIDKLNSNKKTIINTLADKRFDKVRNELMERLNVGLTSQQAVVSRIIESKIKSSLADNEGRINVGEVLLKIEEELNRKRENGGSFYSPHVLHQREQIKNITEEFLSDRNVEKNLSKSFVTIMMEKKSEIGKGWIRKIQNVPLNLSKEEYEKLGLFVNSWGKKSSKKIERVKDEEDRFEDTDIEMNNVVLKPNVEKLEKELEKIREILVKVRKKELQRTVEQKKEDVDDISI